MKRSRKITWLVLAALCPLAIAVWLVPPEVKYHCALEKYKPGTTVEMIQQRYGMRLSLQDSGIVSPSPLTDEQRRQHPAYGVFMPEDYAFIAFNADRQVIDVTKLTPLRGIQKLLGL